MEPSLAFNAAFVLVLVVIAFAAAVKGALGFGFPLISVPIAANLIGARTAVVLIAVSVVFSNLLILIRGGGSVAQLRRFAGMLLGVIFGTAIGAQLLRRLDPGVLSMVVGVTAVLFAIVGLWEKTPAVSSRAQVYVGPSVGLVSGVLGGTTGIFAPLIAAYVHSLQLEKRLFVFWLTAAFFVGGVAQTLSYYRLGLYTKALLGYALATFAPVLVGTQIGFRVQDRLPVQTFRRFVLLLVLLSGLNLILRQLL